jgi:hypothetical protein
VTLLTSSTHRRGPHRLVARGFAYALLLVATFVLGMAVARALDDEPKPGGVVTSVRTLTPLPQQPPARTVTVTVTVTGEP